MKVYISCDMEGVAGIVHRDQTFYGCDGYDKGKELLTAEVNAAIRGAQQAGATEIVVNDSHHSMRNLIIDKLDPSVKIILGDPKIYSMVEGLDSTFDAALFVGYHAKVGTEGAVIDHSYYSSGIVQNVRINGETVGETFINGALAGCFNVPVVFVSGDDKVASEARKTIPNVVAVEVKKGIGRFAAMTLTPIRACELIEAGAKKAVQSLADIKPVAVAQPVNLQVDFSYTTMADVAVCVPGVRRLSGRTVEFLSNDYVEVFKAFHTIYRVAETVK